MPVITLCTRGQFQSVAIVNVLYLSETLCTLIVNLYMCVYIHIYVSVEKKCDKTISYHRKMILIYFLFRLSLN